MKVVKMVVIRRHNALHISPRAIVHAGISREAEHKIRFLRQTTALSHSVELSVAGCWVDGYGVGLKVKPGIWNHFFTPEGRSCFVGIATETSPNLNS